MEVRLTLKPSSIVATFTLATTTTATTTPLSCHRVLGHTLPHVHAQSTAASHEQLPRWLGASRGRVADDARGRRGVVQHAALLNHRLPRPTAALDTHVLVAPHQPQLLPR